MTKSSSHFKLAIGISGASGSIYAKNFLDSLAKTGINPENVGVVASKNAQDIWEFELGTKLVDSIPYKIYDQKDFMAPFASGSAGFDALVVVPCSTGTLGRIASGISDNLITRAADVMLKERKKCLLLVRESPLNRIHLDNMLKCTDAGAVIFPAAPSFYSNPKDFDALCKTVTDRMLDQLGLEVDTYRWGQK